MEQDARTPKERAMDDYAIKRIIKALQSATIFEMSNADAALGHLPAVKKEFPEALMIRCGHRQYFVLPAQLDQLRQTLHIELEDHRQAIERHRETMRDVADLIVKIGLKRPLED